MSHRIAARGLAAALATVLLNACFLAPPVSIGKKDSLLGQGAVIVITNTSDEHLHDVTVEIESPSGEVRRYVEPTLDPHDSMTVGWLKLEGWPIPEGAEVTVSCKDYPLSAGPFKVPS